MNTRHDAIDAALDASFPASDPPSHASPTAVTPLAATTEIPAHAMLYRIVETHRRGDTLAALIGRTEAQWATPETGLIRMATSIPLAMLDYLIELEGPTPHALVLVSVRIPCDGIGQLSHYPQGWDALPCPHGVRAAGDAWAGESRGIALRVPSAICAGECNVLLNPAHVDADCINQYTLHAFRIDPRLRT